MADTEFWLVAGGMAIGVAGLVWAGARSALRAPVVTTDAPLQDLKIYRDQLREVERDLARGTLAETEANRLRTEIARRLLDADKAQAPAAGAGTSRPATLWVTAGVLALAVGASGLLYNRIGAPGYRDMPLAERLAEADARKANRPSQADFLITNPAAQPLTPPDPAYVDLIAKLRAAVDPATSTDLRGLELLAINEAALNDYRAAILAQKRLLSVKGADAKADDYAFLAEIMIRETGGYISPEAEGAIVQALQSDPNHALSRYYSGMLFAQSGRFDRAFALWRPLVDTAPQDAPWFPALRSQIGDVAMLAGVDYTLPEAARLKGPAEADVAAAASLDAGERAEFIETMVSQLSQRLATEGGSAAEWAQLITSLSILGRMDEARAIGQEALNNFTGRDSDLQIIQAALSAVATTDAGTAE